MILQISRLLKKVLSVIKLSIPITFGKVIGIDNEKIKIPIISGLECDLTEVWMIDLLKHLLNEEKRGFLDVGMNLGQTLIKVKGIDLDREYVGFEPNPSCVAYIRELIKTNQFTDCTIIPVGLFTTDSILLLESMFDNEADANASVISGYRPEHTIHHKIPVPVFSFETVSNALTINDIGIVKIDVEGAELEVVKSLYKLFKSCRSILLLEILPVYMSENIRRLERQKELEKIFSELSYSTFRVCKNEDNFVGLRKINEIGIHSDLEQCDYVLIHNESLDVIESIVIN